MVSCWVILDKEAKKEKKKRNFRGRRWCNSTEPEKIRKQRLEALTEKMNAQRNAEIINSPR